MKIDLPTMKKLAILVLLIQLSGCAATPGKPERSVSDKLNDSDKSYVKLGHKLPVVVLQSGFSDGKNVWTSVAEDLSRDLTIFAYDRPGHGGSPANDAPRDPCSIAAELRGKLRSAGLQPPYVLIGHSLGGLYQYVFARLYPSDVAGLVLLDPTHPKHWETMQRDVPSSARMIKVMGSVAFSRTDRREFDAQTTCLDRLDVAHPLGVPTRLLVSGRFKSMEKGDYETMLKRLRQDWPRLTQAPKVEVIHDSGHYIQKDSPEDVAAAVRSLVAGMPGGRQ